MTIICCFYTSRIKGSVYTGPDLFGTGTKLVCVYTGPGGSGTEWICYLVLNESTYEGDPMWNRTVPISNRSRVNRVDPIPNGSEHILSRVNVAKNLNLLDLVEGYASEVFLC